jgi:hypothetical protein
VAVQVAFRVEHPRASTSDRLHVNGVAKLRVADASIMPDFPSMALGISAS